MNMKQLGTLLANTILKI